MKAKQVFTKGKTSFRKGLVLFGNGFLPILSGWGALLQPVACLELSIEALFQATCVGFGRLGQSQNVLAALLKLEAWRCQRTHCHCLAVPDGVSTTSSFSFLGPVCSLQAASWLQGWVAGDFAHNYFQTCAVWQPNCQGWKLKVLFLTRRLFSRIR